MNAYLFVYGTLLQDTEHDMSKILVNHATFVGEGCFQGKLYRVSWFPGAIISDSSSDKVYGRLYKLTDAHLIFRVLDAYEGASESSPKPHLFKRKQVSVCLEKNNKVSAWVYLYNRSTEGLKDIPSGDFLSTNRNKNAL